MKRNMMLPGGLGMTCLAVVFLLMAFAAPEKKKDKEEKKEISDTIKSGDVSGLKFRSIGPAFTSGRIADFAVNPGNCSEYYVAVAHGHVWKTVNNGTTFEPVFDNYGAFSMGCLAMDPKNSSVVWLGTGENNHQRALSWGNGVYKTTDGGKSWTNMGLKESRQIGMIAIHPENTDIVFVAAEGSVWGPGGDRGLYRTKDGGKTWEKVLEISENTGVNNVIIDPRDPNIMYATSEQRRRHVFTKIGGGPESAVYKSTDGGTTWRKIMTGLPGGDIGGMGIAISPVNPDVLYLIAEAQESSSGFFRSSDRGESWQKMSDHTAQGQYYNEIYCDAVNVDKVYSMETVSQFTDDGGRTWKEIGLNGRHVDDHVIWVEPADPNHLMIGSDGGIYESFDAGKTFLFKSNLPVTQFYRVNVDNSEPFYWVYGGTQDNSSFGGPSASTNGSGVQSSDWVVTLGGDGFWQAIDPTNPDIVYSEYQYGNIYRFDKKSGESLKIKPQPRKGEESYKWNWNSPFILSPHSSTRLYMAANKVFRSDDRGSTWKVISEDITRKTDRNTWPVMGRYWGVDAVAKDVSTSLYGMAVSLAESKLKEDLVYVGTDDGVIQVTEDAGQNWSMTKDFPGVPEYTYVSDIFPSRFNENVVFASFNNHQRDDFKPYLLKSADKGKSWTSIAGNLPEKEPVHCIIQDTEKEDLLFAGTEFGIYFSVDGGKIWTELSSGIPDVSVMDIEIQERENDLVLATFGRGFYILDNFTPLRTLTEELRNQEAHIFPIKKALMFIQTDGKYGQGSNYFYAENPAFGATFTYYLKESPKTLKQIRQEKESKLVEDKQPVPIPPMDSLRAEENEVKPYLTFKITDVQGHVIRRLYAAPSEGINRITWDLRYPGPYPVDLQGDKFDPLASAGWGGIMVMPGKYQVSLCLTVRGETKELVGPNPFDAAALNNTTLPAEDRDELVAFQKEVSGLTRAMEGARQQTGELMKRTRVIRQTLQSMPDAPPDLVQKVVNLEKDLDQILWTFNGQPTKASDEENWPAQVPLNERLWSVIIPGWGSTSAITQTQKDVYAIILEEFPPVLEKIRQINDVSMKEIESELNAIGAPWTPGRVPEWNK
jgi:photosystem II stability/assembly factor-like uncharacterized protein